MQKIPSFPVPKSIEGVRQKAFILGVACIVLSAIGAFLDMRQFMHSYLLAFICAASVPLGSLGILMLQHMTGGAWGLVIRRILEAATRTIPLVALLFLPILFGMHDLYPWTHADVVQKHEVLQLKQGWLNVPFFIIRAIIYFAVWLYSMWVMNKNSALQDIEGDTGALTKNMQRWAGPGTLLFVLTVSFAAFDWIMSLNPEWYSTIYGLIIVIAFAVSAFAFSIFMLTYFIREEPLMNVVTPSHLHDLGKLLFAFVMVWAYFSFSQFLIIWAGNLPEEIPWYLDRIRGGWEPVALFVIFVHFALPFTLLLSRDIKRNSKMLAMVALLVLATRMIDFYWLIEPDFHKQSFYLSWMDVTLPVGLLALVFVFFIAKLKERSLLPFNDPFLPEALEVSSAH